MTPVLRTARLRLRPFRETDLDAYAAMCADAEVMQHIGTGGPVDRVNAWRQIAIFVGHWELRGYGMWALEHEGRLVGRAGFLHGEGWPGCELGWLLARDTWGRGLAFEAANAALRYGRDALGLGEVISLIRAGNTRSIALAERMGATNTGPIEFMGGEALRYLHRGA